jgi:Flp pilus assembly protein TadG
MPNRISARMFGRQRRTRDAQRGQSLVEFALVLPIILILVLGIVDFARLYTTMFTVESAAREAADYGAFHWWYWQDATTSAATETEMQRRACVAVRNLPDYTESGGTCTNPSFASTTTVAPYPGAADCTTEPHPPADPPCQVTVTLTYTFHLFAPVGIDFFGTRLGLPSTLTFSRDSTFAIANFGIDAP